LEKESVRISKMIPGVIEDLGVTEEAIPDLIKMAQYDTVVLCGM
jgi:hypothetical protein